MISRHYYPQSCEISTIPKHSYMMCIESVHKHFSPFNNKQNISQAARKRIPIHKKVVLHPCKVDVRD